HRTDPITFAVAGFTQLSIDHLDYHASVEEYFEAKSRLFVPERCDAAVILVDDVWGQQLFALAASRLSKVYALSLEGNLPHGAAGWNVDITPDTGAFTLRGTDGSVSHHECGLPGAYNAANAALAVT